MYLLHIPSEHSVHATTLRIYYLLEDWLAVISSDGSVILHVNNCLEKHRYIYVYSIVRCWPVSVETYSTCIGLLTLLTMRLGSQLCT